jgi:dynein heavy chain
VRNMEQNNSLKVVKLTDGDYLRTLENAVQFGQPVLLENVQEELDPALEPLLQKQVFKQGGVMCIQLGDSAVEYSPEFRFYITTKLRNPHYLPEVAVKVALLNFMITPEGLSDQMLGIVVAQERPDLEEAKNRLIVQGAANKRQLKEIEDQILHILSSSSGNILEDESAISTLNQSKAVSDDIKEKQQVAEATEREIDEVRAGYTPVAFRTQLMFFCIGDLANIEPVYQYSLGWYYSLFIMSIKNSDKSSDLEIRMDNLIKHFTRSLYNNVCRSLLEKDKLLFSFLLCVKILFGDGEIDPNEWYFLLTGGVAMDNTVPNPSSDWILDKNWGEISRLAALPAFNGLIESFSEELLPRWKDLYDSADAHQHELPGEWNEKLNQFQKLLVTRCIRPDKVVLGVQNFVLTKMGEEFVKPPPFNLGDCYNDSTYSTPLVFILSAGSDPMAALLKFADTCGVVTKSISLGQGQGPIAEAMIEEGKKNGTWVVLQNCHLAVSWMNRLEKICELLPTDECHEEFRLWCTTYPSKDFPVAVLQNGVKMTNEPPKGLRANLIGSYRSDPINDPEFFMSCSKGEIFRHLVFGLAFFHAMVQERRQFGPLGWNIPYEFNESDLSICKSQLERFLDQYEVIPYEVLNILTSYINYGGRVTDDKDLRTIDIILRKYFRPEILEDNYQFSKSGLYYSCPCNEDTPLESYNAYIDQLPINPDPEVFGMHDNANITCNMNDTYALFDTVLSLQPRASSGGGVTREEQITELAQSIFADVPEEFNIEAISMRYPVVYEESMNTVLVQESIRYNNLIAVMRSTLVEIQKALKGQVVMSGELEDMGNSLYNQWVPVMWEAKAYPSLKPLGAWVLEFVERVNFIGNWIDKGIPPCFWISGFFFPQAFMTGTLQNFARKYVLPIDTISFAFNYMSEDVSELTARPEDGCYINGMYIEGARWDMEEKCLMDPLPKELYATMPVIHLMPVQGRQAPQTGIYRCPVYKILSRAGMLSTTGHSTNFVVWIEVPSFQEPCFRQSLVSETNANVKFADQESWIKAGVACFLSLRY